MDDELDNGVKPRFDGRGSKFGLLHRMLPKECPMTDIDGILIEKDERGQILLQTENKSFIEYYISDNEMKFKAFFEFKYKHGEQTEKILKSKDIECDFKFQGIHALITLSRIVNARFFLVIANKGELPFKFFEYNFETRVFDYKLESTKGYFDKVWNHLNLL